MKCIPHLVAIVVLFALFCLLMLISHHLHAESVVLYR